MIRIILAIVTLTCFALSGCSKAIPVISGNLMTISRSGISGHKLHIQQESDDLLLSVRWFGTANYYILLGDLGILTDPFVSYQSLFRVIFGGYIRSDPRLVKSSYGGLKPANAIFIGHSHYDHMLDTVEALKLSGWNSVPVYGSKTTKNILAGYKKESTSSNRVEGRWSENWRATQTLEWIEVYPIEGRPCEGNRSSPSLRICYKAFRAEHAPHLPPNFKYFSGKVTMPLKEPPRRANQFKEGKTYVYLFRLIQENRENKEVSYIVGIVGAATNMENDLVGVNEDVDILILCVPGWQYKKDYPGKLIEAFRPRVIILSHFDDFFEPDRQKRPIKFVPTAGFYEFLHELQTYTKYDRFEEVLVPSVGTTMYFFEKEHYIKAHTQ